MEIQDLFFAFQILCEINFGNSNSKALIFTSLETLDLIFSKNLFHIFCKQLRSLLSLVQIWTYFDPFVTFWDSTGSLGRIWGFLGMNSWYIGKTHRNLFNIFWKLDKYALKSWNLHLLILASIWVNSLQAEKVPNWLCPSILKSSHILRIFTWQESYLVNLFTKSI